MEIIIARKMEFHANRKRNSYYLEKKSFLFFQLTEVINNNYILELFGVLIVRKTYSVSETY